MKHTELRCGNLLEWNDESHDIISVKSIIEESGQYFVHFDGGGATLDEFIPIKLTEYWLLRAGAKRKSKTVFELHRGFILIDGVFHDYITGVNLPFVHNFQNFMFAIRLEEIKFIEP